MSSWPMRSGIRCDSGRKSRRSSVLSPKYEVFCCDQNGPPARREEGAYLNRYVTDEQRGRRPIFNATLRAAAGWLFFRVARSARMDPFDALSLAHGKPSDANAADTRDTGHVRNRIECPEQATARRMGQIWALLPP